MRGTRARRCLAAGWVVLVVAGAGATLVLDADIEKASERYRWDEYAPEGEGPPPTPTGDPCAPPETPTPGRFRVCLRSVTEPNGIPSRWGPLEEGRARKRMEERTGEWFAETSPHATPGPRRTGG